MQDIIKYGFQAYLSPEFPSQVIVDVTEFCNLACIHCPQSEFSKSEAFGGRHLAPDLHRKLIDEVAKDGKGYCKYLRYTGQGETLLHPNFIEMIQHAKKYSGVPVNVTTNGMLLAEKKAMALLDAGVDVFDISIDANTPETYALIRRKGNLDITRPNVLKLIELIRKGGYKTKVVVSFVEQPLNKHESADFEKFWKDAGADYVIIRRLHSCAGSKEKVAGKMKELLKKERRPCLYPWERLVLSPTGQIGFCPADWKYQAKVAFLRDTTIKEIWKGDYMNRLREAHLRNDFSDFPLCGNCPDWSAVRWPEEGRAYANMMLELVPSDLIDTES
jgi:MoaA/NifB/PqqE/SkfB family radical SAM enzyme